MSFFLPLRGALHISHDAAADLSKSNNMTGENRCRFKKKKILHCTVVHASEKNSSALHLECYFRIGLLLQSCIAFGIVL